MNNNQGRRRTRRARKNTTNIKRILLTICMMALVAAVSIGGTIAWLTDDTESVVNTFTNSDVDISLEETIPGTENQAAADNAPVNHNYQMVPGRVISKDPHVVIRPNSEKSWIFVTVEKTDVVDTYLTYRIAEGWTRLNDGTNTTDTNPVGTYFRIANETGDEPSAWMPILAGDSTRTNGIVTVNTTVTKQDMDDLEEEGATQPQLTFTAYAVQYEGFEVTNWNDAAEMQGQAAAAWATISGN